MSLEIKNITLNNLDNCIILCIQVNKRGDPSFIEGFNEKKRWAKKILEKYGNFAKVAYLNSEPVGFIQYLLRPEERIVEIMCIFIPEEKNLRKGIGKKLLESLRDEVNRPSSYFNNEIPDSIINYPIDIPGRFPQSEFFIKFGFKKILINGLLCLYYPLKEGFIYVPKEKDYIPQKEDKERALIFYDPSCPFCIYFSEKMKEIIKNINPEIAIKFINQYEESYEVEKRGKVYNCIVNQIPIKSFFLDKENFEKEVIEALKKIKK